MATFKHHTVESAPDSTQHTLADIQKSYGFIPNLYGYLAESPVALNAYLHINDQLMNHSSLTPANVQIALLAMSVVNQCEFCVAAHSWGTQAHKANPQTVEAIRTNSTIKDKKDAALVALAQSIVNERGFVPEPIVDQFLDAGFTQENVMDLLVCNMLKSLSNYANHLTGTEVNKELAAFAR